MNLKHLDLYALCGWVALRDDWNLHGNELQTELKWKCRGGFISVGLSALYRTPGLLNTLYTHILKIYCLGWYLDPLRFTFFAAFLICPSSHFHVFLQQPQPLPQPPSFLPSLRWWSLFIYRYPSILTAPLPCHIRPFNHPHISPSVVPPPRGFKSK